MDQPRKFSALAIAAVICSLIPIIGLFFGLFAMTQIRASGELRGRRLAIAAVGLGTVTTVLLFIAAYLPVLLMLRGGRSQHENASRMRSVHYSMILYAQGNNGWYPGIDPSGATTAPDVEQRFFTLLSDSQLPSTSLTSPNETKTPWSSGPFTTANYSFTLLQIPPIGERRMEWRQTNNPEAPVISDRLIPNGTGWKSILTKPEAPNAIEWRGFVGWNDNHVTFESDFTLDTKYGRQTNTDDNLFAPTSDADAYMIYSGNK